MEIADKLSLQFKRLFASTEQMLDEKGNSVSERSYFDKTFERTN
jgi:hypothetical protein